MKEGKLILFGIVSVGVFFLDAQSNQAQTLNANTNGQITLNVDTDGGGIVDPPTEGGGETIVPPVIPPVVGDKDLALICYPTFDFGTHDYTGAAAKYYAQPLTGTVDGVSVVRPQFVQVRNSSSVSQWNLKVTASQFIAQNGKNTSIPGMLMTLNDVNKTNNTENGGSAIVANQTLPLTPGQAQTIGTYNNTGITGTSRNSFMFGMPGNVTAENYQGVQLDIPGSLELENAKYLANITWTLADTL